MRLKYQFIALVTLSITIIIVLQLVLFNWLSSINTKSYALRLEDTISQLKLKAEAFSADINKVANLASFNDMTYQFMNTTDNGEQLRLAKSMQLMINSILLSNSHIDDIVITNLDLIHIGANNRESFWILQTLRSWYAEERVLLPEPHHYVIPSADGEGYYYFALANSYPTADAEHHFMTVVIYNVNAFKEMVENLHPDSYSNFFIIDSADNVLAVNKHQTWDAAQVRTLIGDWRSGALAQERIGGEVLMHHQGVNPLNWTILGMASKEEMRQEYRQLKQFMWIMSAIVLTVLTVFGLVIHKNMTSPITEIARFMNAIGNRSRRARLVTKHTNEISLLARSLNKMLDNIDMMEEMVVATREKAHQAELAKKEARLLALQSQINPHFLYNTLDCIRGLALSRGSEEISEIATAMARIFRYSIKKLHTVRIKEEIAIIQDYFRIIQIRQNGRLHASFEIDSALDEWLMPKMILQPIVENAVFHGMEQKSGASRLTVIGRITADGKVLFRIQDTGVGMTQELLRQVQESLCQPYTQIIDRAQPEEKDSLGLANIHQRLQLTYGDAYGITIDSVLGTGTEVVVSMPLEWQERDGEEENLKRV